MQDRWATAVVPRNHTFDPVNDPRAQMVSASMPRGLADQQGCPGLQAASKAMGKPALWCGVYGITASPWGAVKNIDVSWQDRTSSAH